MADSTVPVIVVPRTVIQEPVYLARGNRQLLRGGVSLTISSRLALLKSSRYFSFANFLLNHLMSGEEAHRVR